MVSGTFVSLFIFALGASAAAIPAKKDFSGKGQLRTQWYEGNYADLGCLTDSGFWTSNEDLCGTFEANRIDTPYSTIISLKSANGGCQVSGARIVCEGADKDGYQFGLWPWPNAIPGVDNLRWGNYGLMASRNGGPPAPNAEPQEIHMASYSEKGKWVWITWKALEEV